MIGPSNPLVSIDPILAVPGLRDALREARAPLVAVSPIVGGEVLKGPTAAFMRWAGRTLDARGVAEHYRDLLDGIVSDETLPGSASSGNASRGDASSVAPPRARARARGGGAEETPSTTPGETVPALRIDTLMPDAPSRARVAERVLAFADSLRGP